MSCKLAIQFLGCFALISTPPPLFVTYPFRSLLPFPDFRPSVLHRIEDADGHRSPLYPTLLTFRSYPLVATWFPSFLHTLNANRLFPVPRQVSHQPDSPVSTIQTHAASGARPHAIHGFFNIYTTGFSPRASSAHPSPVHSHLIHRPTHDARKFRKLQ
jgi:hypothetical protein